MVPVKEILSCSYNRLVSARHGYLLYNCNDQFVGRGIQLYGEHSEVEMALFQQLVRPNMVIVEAGANIGAHTIALARLVGPGGCVHAFEPQRLVFQTLCANLAVNGISNVFARQAALADKPGTRKVPCLNPNLLLNFGGLSLEAIAEGETVPVETIDDLGLKHCHLLKVDVEGMELDVLKGAAHTIGTHKPVLYVENDREDKSRALIGYIQGLGYRLYWDCPPLFNPQNHYGNASNVFRGLVSINMLCVHPSTPVTLNGFRPIDSPDSRWRTQA